MVRALELFCGIGGFAAAAIGRCEVVRAIDVDQRALAVYGHNFPHHPRRVGLIETLPEREFVGADLWWASPPCQPYTSRGLRRDLDDPRAASLPVLARRLHTLRPRFVAIENVAQFARSRARDLLREALDQSAYDVEEVELCPTTLGVPNRRPRWYLVAALDGLPRPTPAPPLVARGLGEFVKPDDDPTLVVAAQVASRFAEAMRVVDRNDPAAIAPTFTAGYATSPVQAGGFLATPSGPRRFAPDEILSLLGFPRDFSWPPEVVQQARWRLVGNSLSVIAVQNRLDRLLGTRSGLPAG